MVETVSGNSELLKYLMTSLAPVIILGAVVIYMQIRKKNKNDKDTNKGL